jgi:hypothetical protein
LHLIKGDDWGGAPDIDHTNPKVQQEGELWLIGLMMLVVL